MRLSNTPAAVLLAVAMQGGLFTGCQTDRSEFGAEFIPPREEQSMVTESLGAVSISIRKASSSRVTKFTNFALGEVRDATFGKTQCAASVELFPSSSDQIKTFKESTEAESVALRLKVRNRYGKGRVKVSVFEASAGTHGAGGEKIDAVPHGALLAETTIDETASELHLALPNALGTRIGKAIAKDAYAIAKFRDHFAGLYIVARRETGSDFGTMFFFNAGDRGTGITISWVDEQREKRSVALPIYLQGNRSNWIEHDFGGSKVEQALGKSSQEQDASGLAYLSGDGGTIMTVDFSQFLSQWKGKGLVAVQRAQLLVAMDASSPKGMDTITYGLASFTGEEGSYVPVIDANRSANTYGGWYDHKQGCYVLNITGYVQHLLNVRNYPTSLQIFPANSYRGISRLVLGTCQNPQRPTRLVITYTKL